MSKELLECLKHWLSEDFFPWFRLFPCRRLGDDFRQVGVIFKGGTDVGFDITGITCKRCDGDGCGGKVAPNGRVHEVGTVGRVESHLNSLEVRCQDIGIGSGIYMGKIVLMNSSGIEPSTKILSSRFKRFIVVCSGETAILVDESVSASVDKSSKGRRQR